MTRVTVRHLRMLRDRDCGGWCVPGARAWFARHGLDFEAFVRDGITCETLDAIGDHFALTAATLARMEAEEAGDGQ
jgi:hypothetical protein